MQEANVYPAVPTTDTTEENEEFRAVVRFHATLSNEVWEVIVAGENSDGVTANVTAKITEGEGHDEEWGPFLKEVNDLYDTILYRFARLDTKQIFELAYSSPTLTATRVVEIRATTDFSNFWASETIAAPDAQKPKTLNFIYSEFSEYLEEAVMINIPVNIHRAFYALSQRGFNLKNYSESAMLELGVAEMNNRATKAKKEAAQNEENQA